MPSDAHEPAGLPATSADLYATQPPTLPTSAPSDAVRVPGYEVLDLLGRGGMGVVYKARHLRLNRVVALKMILHAAHAGEDAHQRFLREAEVIAAIKQTHAGIEQQQALILTLQSQVAEQEAHVDEAVAAIDAAHDNTVSQLFTRDSPPVWNRSPATRWMSALVTPSMPSRVSSSPNSRSK